MKYPDYEFLLKPENNVFMDTLLDDVDIFLTIMKDYKVDLIRDIQGHGPAVPTKAEQFCCSIEIFRLMAYLFNQQQWKKELDRALYIMQRYGYHPQQFDYMRALRMACDPRATR